jgi:CheY-like chemotaxis protein
MPPLILAIEPDRRQASKIAAIARNLEAEFIAAESAEQALATLETRVPDLILTPHFLSPRDESALDDRRAATTPPEPKSRHS